MKRILIKTTNTNVLVVDDNEVNLLIAKTTLTQYGINVEAVQSGAAALEKLAENNFDLVVLDCIMPEMDGHETAKRIRALPGKQASVPITAYTANQPEAVLEQFKDVNVQDVLIKPLDTIELTKVLLKYLPDEKLLDKEQVLAELALLGSAVETEETSEETPLKKALSAVPDLDYNTGMHFASNSEESYLRVITAACESMKNISVNVAFFARNLAIGDVSELGFQYGTNDFRVDSHSMKGVCASIGLDLLSKTSAEFEKNAIDNADFTLLLPQLCEYSNHLAEVGNALSAAISSYKATLVEDTPTEYVPMEADKYIALIDETLTHVKCFEIDAIKEGLEKLLASAATANLRTNLKAAIDASDCFDYGKVAQLLNDSRKQLI